MVKMGSKMTPLILTLFIIVSCYGIEFQKNDETLVLSPTPTSSRDKPLFNAGYMIQQATEAIDYVGQLFYFKNNLLYPNRKVNGSVYNWSNQLGMTFSNYYKELKNEMLATVTPTNDDNKRHYIVGSDRNLRLIDDGTAFYNISEPLIQFDDPGFVIYSAHCDKNGIMFILLIGTDEENENLGKLYKIENKQAQFVKDLNNNPRDFRFNNNYTSMYMVCDYGSKIVDFKYDLETAELGDATDVFNKNDYPELKNHFMTSVTVDKKPGHLWVTAAGKEGYILEINPFNKELVLIIPIPSKDLTFITFGLDKNESLLVGSKRTCTKGHAQGAVYAITGIQREGVLDVEINW